MVLTSGYLFPRVLCVLLAQVPHPYYIDHAGGQWTSYTNGTHANSFDDAACATHCLFNLTSDSSEHVDVSASYPDVLAKLLARYENSDSVWTNPSVVPGRIGTSLKA